MTADAFILFASDTDWRICALTDRSTRYAALRFPADTTAHQRAEQVAIALQAIGYGGEGTILAVPSSWCYAASISTDDLSEADRKAMLYRLEEKLPVEAESLVADFIAGGDGVHRALGVAVRTDSLKELVDALEAAGVAVQSSAPAALLAAQGLAAVETQEPYVLLCGEGAGDTAQVNLIAFEAGCPTGWALLAADLTDVKLQLELAILESERPPRVEACGVDADLVNAITEQTGMIVGVREEAGTDVAALFGGQIASGRQRPWVEFRRGPLAIRDPLRLHRRPLNALLASAAIFLLAFAGVMMFRGARYERAARAAEAQMADAFARQFPGWTVPANVRAVVASEHRKGDARTGASLPAEAAHSALQTLHDVLDKLPADGRFTIDHVTFDDGGFVMDGRLRSYEEVDRVAAAARQAGMIVEPPQARKDAAGTWTFTIHGTAKPGTVVAFGRGAG